MILSKRFLFIAIGLISLPLLATEPSVKYVKVAAKKGQGAYSILRSYQLLDNVDNIKRFYEINKIKNGAELEKGQTYLLPIQILNFDGKSIRSSVNIKDYSKAKEIQTYNEAMVAAGLKAKQYSKDKIVWLPEFISKKDNIKVNNSEAVVNKAINSSPKEEDAKILIADNKLEEKLLPNKKRNADIDINEDSNSIKESFVKKVSSKTLSVSLFGKEHKEVPIESDDLKDQIFYIVPGHGGPDPGAMFTDKESDRTFCEDEYAYDVSLRLARNLMTRGATVYMIVQDKSDGIRDDNYLECDNDETCLGLHEMPINQVKRLRQGMIKTNQLFFKHKLEGIKNQWMISIHIDSQPEENRQDVYFYYQSESKPSKKKAKQLKSVFSEKYRKYQERDYKGTISARPLYVMRTSEPDPIFIELANIRNEQDRKRITSPRNRQLLADWIMEGFL
ncbi:MAG: N-acetylmuramoyl-L-alanine amidase [Saprospiraceae bacterium]|nr:N-acetylmuramoyl-L-alanine amidase [Saprospiraceae bacterium]